MDSRTAEIMYCLVPREELTKANDKIKMLEKTLELMCKGSAYYCSTCIHSDDICYTNQRVQCVAGNIEYYKRKAEKEINNE